MNYACRYSASLADDEPRDRACDRVLQIIIRSLQRELVYKDEVNRLVCPGARATLLVNVAWN